MKVYVASAYGNREHVQEVFTILQDAGHVVSHDWTTESADHLPHGSPEYYRYLEQCGARDYLGIMDAHVLLLLAHPEMKDTRTELGIALGCGMQILVVDHPEVHSVFYGHHRVTRYPTVDAAIYALAQY